MRISISLIPFRPITLSAVISLILTISFLAPAWAQQADRERIIITATRTEELVDRVPASVTVLTRKEIDLLPATTLQGLLENVSGIMVHDLYGNGAQASADFRGNSHGRATAVLVDGRKVNRPGSQAVDWNLIPLENVERIEIVKGGSAGVIYGDSAVSAVINIITRGAVAGEGVWNLDGMVGNQGETVGSVSVGGTDGRMLYYLFARMAKAGGYRENGGGEARDLNIRLTDNFMENYYFGFEYIYHKDEQDVPGPLTAAELSADRTQAGSAPVKSGFDVSTYGFTLGEVMSQEMLVEVQYYVEDVQNDAEGSGYAKDNGLLTTRTILKMVYGSDEHAFTAGLDIIEHDEDTAIQDSGVDTDLSLTKKETGYYINDSYSFSDSMVLQAGYRKAEAEYDFSISGTCAGGPLDKQGSLKVEEKAYNLGMAYVYGEGSRFYTNYTHGFRFPSTHEIMDPCTGAFYRLKTEVSETKEVGLVHTFGGGTNIRATYFTGQVDDEVIMDGSGPAQESTKRSGYELGFSYGLMEGMALDVNYVKTDAEITSGAYGGSQVPLVPEQAASASLSARFGSLTFVFQGRWTDNRIMAGDLANSEPDMSEYVTLNGKMSYDFQGGIFYIGVNNIMEEEYLAYADTGSGSPVYYPAPGRWYYAGIRMAL